MPVHRKPLTSSSQSFEFYSCYLGKDAGYDHADMAMSENIDPEQYSMWMAEYVLIRGDLFKDKIALDNDNNLKILHGVYNANLFPLPASHFLTLLFSLRLGTHIIHPSVASHKGTKPHPTQVEALWRTYRYNNPAMITPSDAWQAWYHPSVLPKANPDAPHYSKTAFVRFKLIRF